MIKPAGKHMFNHVANNMRAADRSEVWAACHETPAQALHNSWLVSTYCNAIVVDGEPIAIFGVGDSDDPEVGFPWLLGTDKITTNYRYFVKITKPIVEEMSALKATLVNYVHVDNAQSVRWLRYGGFTIEPNPIQFGREQELFYQFWRCTDV